jgi:hypothetical protein
VTVGEEKERVKDSASVDGIDIRTPGLQGDGRSSKSDSGKFPKTFPVLVIATLLTRSACIKINSCHNSLM